MARKHSRENRYDYLRDRMGRRGRRSGRDRRYMPMDYSYDYPEHNVRKYPQMRRDKRYDEERYMEYEQPMQRYGSYDYDMRYDYRSDKDNDKEYHEDLKEWQDELKKYDRFGLSKDQTISRAKEMGADFKEYDEEEFYAIYLMHISDYPFIANEPNTYLAMAKAWLDDEDLDIEPSEKVCKYLYEIVMADED